MSGNFANLQVPLGIHFAHLVVIKIHDCSTPCQWPTGLISESCDESHQMRDAIVGSASSAAFAYIEIRCFISSSSFPALAAFCRSCDTEQTGRASNAARATKRATPTKAELTDSGTHLPSDS